MNALDHYQAQVKAIIGGMAPKSTTIIQGRTFPPSVVTEHLDRLVDAVREVATALAEPSSAEAVAP